MKNATLFLLLLLFCLPAWARNGASMRGMNAAYDTGAQNHQPMTEGTTPSISSANFGEIVGPALAAQFQASINWADR